MSLLPRLLAATTILGSTASANSPSWSGWRGDGRDAEVADFKVPEAWPEKLDRVWSVEVGDGYATPLVKDGRIYQHAREGGEEVLWCLDAESGKTIWRKAMAIDFVPGRGGEKHGLGPKSTPTLADGRVFTLSISGTLAGWSADDGELLWKRDFRDRFDETHPYWGTATSPVVEDGRLYAHTGSCEKGALFCLDPKTGEDIWVQDQHANCYSSPLVEVVDGVRQLIEFNHHGMCGVDLKTGRLLWESFYPHRGNNQNVPTPVFHGGLFVAGGENRGMFAVRAWREDGKWRAEQAWKHRDVSLEMSSPVISGDVVYGFSHFKTGQFFGLDPASGEVLWRGEARAGDNAQFLSVPGHVLALNDRGELHVMRTSREKCDILRTYPVGDNGTWTAPALTGDALLIKDGDVLVKWRVPAGG